MVRPRKTKKDTNHNIVLDVVKGVGWMYQGLDLTLIDTADLPSSTGFLDWLLFIGALPVLIEVKTWEKRTRYTDGERKTLAEKIGVIPVEVVTCAEDVASILKKYAPIAYMVLPQVYTFRENKPIWWDWLGVDE